MTQLICHNCGQVNSTESTFCSKCATHLRRSQLKLQHQTQVFVPPQIVTREPVVTPLPQKSSSAGWVILGMMVVIGGFIIWWTYGLSR